MRKRRMTIAGLLLAIAAVVPPLAIAAPAHAALSDFRVSIQLIDDGGRAETGPLASTPFLIDGGGSSAFARDANGFDPDGARLLLSSTGIAANLDFRICGQAIDNPSPRGAQFGPYVCSPWASEGGGYTPLVTDDNQFDPDGYRIALEVQPVYYGVQINDVRLSIIAMDFGDRDLYGPTQFTPWQSQGGGFSPYAFDPNHFDPDGFFFGIHTVLG